MFLESYEIKALGALVLFLLILYFWVRRIQQKHRLERDWKSRCKDLVLNNRNALAREGVDFEKLAELVRMKIKPDQLEMVIHLLTAGRVQYNIDDREVPDNLEADLDFEKRRPPVTEAADNSSQESEPVTPETFEKMNPEQEKTWLQVVHNRFRKAVAEKEITERRAKLKLLVRMVELGKKAVEDDPNKAVARKGYELSLWDRFYEKEYLEINYE
ncbi:MAG TPA: hypothetical protein VM123_06645 [archaeon]|nr:hypothetical protein [archaeon]